MLSNISRYFIDLVLVAVMVLSAFALVSTAYAQVQTGGGSNTVVTGGKGQLNNPLAPEYSSIDMVLNAIVDILIVFAVPLIVFFIMYAGFLYVTARGNEGTIEKAHYALTYAVIGGVLILGAKAILYAVQGTVNQLF
jgi:hypothetical protein